MRDENYELLIEKESIKLQNLFDKIVIKRSKELLSKKDLNEYLDSYDITRKRRVDYVGNTLWEGINLLRE